MVIDHDELRIGYEMGLMRRETRYVGLSDDVLRSMVIAKLESYRALHQVDSRHMLHGDGGRRA